MPFFYDLEGTVDRVRAADRLLALRDQLAEKIPRRTLADTLLLATWNIREFDSPKYGDRLDESILYIAEIVSHFDLVAIQEVRADLAALERLRETLGEWWNYVVTDVTEGVRGNRERLAFLYDSRKVRFGGLAGEAVIPPKKVRGKERDPSAQLSRTPYIAGLEAGWFKFMLCTVHIVYGKNRSDSPGRVEEVRLISNFMANKVRDRRHEAWSRNVILLGDFNIFQRENKTYQAIVKEGFEVPDALHEVPATNVGRKARHYEQIATMVRHPAFEVTDAGVFDFYQSVFRDEDQATYAPLIGDRYHTSAKGKLRPESGKRTYYRTHWRTHQMSDHLPMWVELKTEFGEEYLRQQAAS